jgi:hypothetical protein
MYRKIASFLVTTVIIAGGLFSAYNNFLLFASILGADLAGVLWSVAGLALFDLGALGWLMYFAHSAKGNAQRAVAALAGVACLLLTLVAAGTHIILAQTFIDVPEWAGQVVIGAILAALAINLIAAAASHMADPETLRAMREQGLNDEKQEALDRAQMSVFREALRQTEARVAANAATVSAQLSAEFADDATREMLSMTAGGASTSALPARPAQTPDPTPAAGLNGHGNGRKPIRQTNGS